jgi:S1-C subfamily serine protease
VLFGGLFAFCIVGGGALLLYFIVGDQPSHIAHKAGPHSGQLIAEPEPPPPVVAEEPDDPQAVAPAESEPILDPPLREAVVDAAPKGAPPLSPTGQLAPEILAKVKRATVFIKVTAANGQQGSGSGFFGVEPGVVLTNAHVVGMMAAGAGKPQRCEVTVNSGEGPDEKTLPGEVISVDRVNDLAVLRVKLDKQPTPLEVKSALNLKETQPLFVFGFPFGATLGKNVTVAKTSVSSLRKDPASGVLSRVQVQGGMHPGNSGGPVVDAWGDVVGVSVAKFIVIGQDTNIDFAVPGDYVHVILGGRLSELSCGLPYRDGDKIKLPVTVQALDPLHRIRKLAVDYWVGNPGKSRPATRTEPKAEAGDGARQTLLLTYKGGVGKGELILPELPPGKAYWLQPNYGSGGGTKWALARPCALPPFVEHKPTTLKRKFTAGDKQDLLVSQKSTLRIRDAQNVEHPLVNSLEIRLTDTVEGVDDQGTANVRRQYNNMRARIVYGGQRPEHPLQPARPYITTLAAKVRLEPNGKVRLHEADVPPGAVPQAIRPILVSVHEQYAQPLLEVLEPLLPGNEVQPGATWQEQRGLRTDTTGGQHEMLHLNLTYTYAGLRTRAGRTEAVLTLGGRGRPGSAATENGDIHGTLALDLETGRLTEADVTMHLDVSIPGFFGQSLPASSVQELKLRSTGDKTAGKS